MSNIEQLIKNGKGTILDVRTKEEFASGHVANSVNIPLQELNTRVNEIKQMSAPIILCCASGMRSRQAEGFLANQGIDCCNAGSWIDIELLK